VNVSRHSGSFPFAAERLTLQQAFFGLPYFMTNHREGSRSWVGNNLWRLAAPARLTLLNRAAAAIIILPVRYGCHCYRFVDNCSAGHEESFAYRSIHATPVMAVLVITGGGVQALTDLLTVPGASRTVLEALVPTASSHWLRFLCFAGAGRCLSRLLLP